MSGDHAGTTAQPSTKARKPRPIKMPTDIEVDGAEIGIKIQARDAGSVGRALTAARKHIEALSVAYPDPVSSGE